MRLKFLIFLFILTIPLFAKAKVIINEIAWMGTENSASDEWIELYNDSSDSVDLTGWILEAADGTPGVELSGSIATGGFFLMERTDDETVPGIAADLIYTGAISNSGEVLVLKNSQGAEVDRVDASGGWPAGDNSTKDTMQFVSGGWLTAPPTPRAENAAGQTPDFSEDEPDPPTSGSSDEPLSSGSDSFGLGVSPPAPEPKMSAVIKGERVAIAGADIILRGEVFGFDKKPIENADYLWNFGDGSVKRGKIVSHNYIYPGSYVLFLNASSGAESVSASALLSVLPNQLRISEIMPGENSWIEIQNNSSRQINISRWGLAARGAAGKTTNIFRFPESTFIKSGTYLVVASEISGIATPQLKGRAELLYPDGKPADIFEYNGALGKDESFSRSQEKAVITVATPGSANASIKKDSANPAPPVKAPPSISTAGPKTEKETAKPPPFLPAQEKESLPANVEIAALHEEEFSGPESYSSKRWLLAVLAAGIFGAGGIVFIRRLAVRLD